MTLLKIPGFSRRPVDLIKITTRRHQRTTLIR